MDSCLRGNNSEILLYKNHILDKDSRNNSKEVPMAGARKFHLSLKGKARYVYETFLFFNMKDQGVLWHNAVCEKMGEDSPNSFSVANVEEGQHTIDIMNDAFNDLLREVWVKKAEMKLENVVDKSNEEESVSCCTWVCRLFSPAPDPTEFDFFDKTHLPDHVKARAYCRELQQNLMCTKTGKPLFSLYEVDEDFEFKKVHIDKNVNVIPRSRSI
jgi:hypothetical protein